MGMKSKDLTDLLAAKGVEDVKAQRALTDREFSVLFQALTEAHQVDNIYDYMDGKTRIPSRIAEKRAAEKAKAAKAAAEKVAAERAAAEKAAAEKEQSKQAKSRYANRKGSEHKGRNNRSRRLRDKAKNASRGRR